MRARKRQGGLSVRAAALATTIAIGVAAVATACSSGGAAAASCPTSVGVGPHTINYGLLYPDSGLNSTTFGPYRTGVDARLGVANAKGGVYGRQVSYTWADDQSRASTNLVAAQRLVNDDKAFAIEELSQAPQGSAQWLNQQNVPVVGTSNSTVWTQYHNIFSYLNIVTSSGSVSTWGDYAKQQGVKKAVVLYSQSFDGSRLVGTAFRDSLLADGIQARMVDVEPTTLDIPTVVKTIKNSGADMITGILDGDAFLQIAVADRAQQPTMKILSPVGYDQQVLILGRQLAGMTVFTGYRPFERPVPAHQTFLNAMAEYAPQQQPAASEVSLLGWMDTDLLLRGLQAAGPCPTRQSFMTNLRAVTNFDAGGLLASPVNMGTSFGKLTVCYSFLQISADGRRFVPVSNAPLCGRRIT